MKKYLQVLLPVYNEEKSIPKVLKEVFHEISKTTPFEFILTEDGSTDGTKELLRQLKGVYPILLITSVKRKGYAKAIIDGMKKVNCEYVLCLDSDGQYYPKDFIKLWKLRKQNDIVIGWRIKRADVLQRRLLSGGFKFLYRLIFSVKIHDPSCPLILIKRETLMIIVKELGVLKEGFWWEFVARANKRFIITEVKIRHRKRTDGETRVYSLDKLPYIAFSHILGLYKIYKQLKYLDKFHTKSSN